MFYFFDITNIDGSVQRHIIKKYADGACSSFPAIDENPNMVEFEAWVADGNTAEEWNPDAITEPVVQPTTEPDTTTESVES